MIHLSALIDAFALPVNTPVSTLNQGWKMAYTDHVYHCDLYVFLFNLKKTMCLREWCTVQDVLPGSEFCDQSYCHGLGL